MRTGRTPCALDVVVIGVGYAGSILSKELAASGLKVVGLERGKGRHTVPDFQAPSIYDELKYAVHKGMMQDVHTDQVALAKQFVQQRPRENYIIVDYALHS